MKSPHRAVVAAVAALSAAAAPPAGAAVSAEAASYAGTFTSTCTMRVTLEGPQNGPYTCRHTTRSTACAAVADTGSVTTYAKVCRADLTAGSTAGSATAVARPWEVWTCDNGAGTGTFRYQPSTSDPLVFSFPVTLTVADGDIAASGSYTQAGTGRHIVVRAHFPAVCAYNTTAAGYAGTVSAF